ncbi:MAG: NAD(P)H-hydrate dehydratase [Chloroflexi bacterium]|nr:NAD(P)H-hydrate dehydratase [Chloroflexota bacterium]
MKLVTTEEMRRLEAEAAAAGVSYATMMEHAGKAVADAIVERVDPKTASVVVLVGPGNNGGDGLVAARHLTDAGATVKVYCLKPPEESDSKVVELRNRSIFLVDADNDTQSRVLRHSLGGANVIVDALFGTGARLPLRDKAAQVLRQAAGRAGDGQRRPYIVAVDCPSGTNCDTGEVDGNTIKADLTVTFGAAKIGQYKFPAADYVGELIVADIGWAGLPGLQAINLELADSARAKATLPERRRDAHKYTFGKTLIVAGSKNFVGAAYLAGAAAYRAGTGLVTLAVPDSIQPILATQLPEATWLPLPESSGAIAESAAEVVSAQLGKADALILGPGFGMAEVTLNFLRALLADFRSLAGVWRFGSLVDADGLRLLAQIENWPSLLPKPAILTPHPGEMETLTGLSKEEIQADRLGVARKFAAQWGHVVLLKGAFTVIAAPDGKAAIEPFATAALAKAGSGDVLSGLIGGLLAQGAPPFEAAVAGAFIHGRAAEIAAETLGTTVSIVASDLLKAIPKAIATL